MNGGELPSYNAIQTAIDNTFIPNVIVITIGSDVELIVVDIRGHLSMYSDDSGIKTSGSTINVTGINTNVHIPSCCA